MKFGFDAGWFAQKGVGFAAQKAVEWGYDGIELYGSANESHLSNLNILLSDPAKLRSYFSDGVEACCISTPLAFSSDPAIAKQRGDELKRIIDAAAAISCVWVKVRDVDLNQARNGTATAVAMGDWLAPLGDYAANAGVGILVENGPAFPTAKEIWTALDRIGHRSIACGWSLQNAAKAKEPPAVSVPVLNSKIRYVMMPSVDAVTADVIRRLRGIGYGGFVNLQAGGTSDPEKYLSDAITRLRQWDQHLSMSDAEAVLKGLTT